MPTLRTALWVFLVGFGLHNGDHARRGLDEVRDGVVWGGTAVAMITAVLVTLIVVRHPAAPTAAAVGGASIAVGVGAAHLLPDWGPLSDSLPDGDVDALTWIAVFAEITAAALLAAVAVGILRRHAYRPLIPHW